MPRPAKSTSRRTTSARATPPRTHTPPRTVLLAVLGSTPAVLTETLWALAQATPRVLPDCVVVITTAHGERVLREQLLSPRPDWNGRTVWQALRQHLLGSRAAHGRPLSLETPVVITVPDAATGTARPLDDIRTAQDNEAAGEAILATVRQFATPETRLLGLLAGGRKTMSALLHAALSLAGRPGDRLLHVLVNDPFDDPHLRPLFYFPGQPGPAALARTDGTTHPHAEARPEIADVPLVTLGELVFQHTGHTPGAFAEFIRAADAAIERARCQSVPLQVTYSPATRTLAVNAWTTVLPVGRTDALCAYLCRAASLERDNLDRAALEQRMATEGITYRRPDGQTSQFTDSDISNALNVMREHLHKAGVPDPLVQRLLPHRAPIGFSREGVTAALD